MKLTFSIDGRMVYEKRDLHHCVPLEMIEGMVTVLEVMNVREYEINIKISEKSLDKSGELS